MNARLSYEELHRLAGRYMAGEQDGHTLQTTALVHEVYLRLVDERNLLNIFQLLLPSTLQMLGNRPMRLLVKWLCSESLPRLC